MKKFISKIIILLLSINILGLIISPNVDKKFLKCNQWWGTYKYTWIESFHNEQFDNVFIGSSRVHNMIDANLISNITKSRTINFGLGGSGIDDNFLVLKTILMNGNKIKNLYLQIDHITLDNSFDYPFNNYYWYCFHKAYTNKVLIERDGIIQYILFKYFPLTRYAYFSNFYPNLFLSFANNPIKKDTLNGYDPLLGRKNKLNKLSDKYLYKNFVINRVNQINSLCKQNKINFILFTSPIDIEAYSKTDISIPMNKIKSISSEQNITYWDFSNDSCCQKLQFFYDYHHLNKKGNDIFCRHLANKINETNNLKH